MEYYSSAGLGGVFVSSIPYLRSKVEYSFFDRENKKELHSESERGLDEKQKTHSFCGGIAIKALSHTILIMDEKHRP